MTMQTNKRKLPHIYKELIRRILTFEFEKLLLLKSPQNKGASLEKMINKSDISYMPGAFWDKGIDFTDEPVVQCDALSSFKKYFIR